MSSKVGNGQRAWYTRNRRQASTANLVYYITAFVILYIVALVIVQMYNSSALKTDFGQSSSGNSCTYGLEYIPVYAVLSVLLFILNPLLLFYVRDIEDAYGIRFELVATSLIWFITLTLDLVWIYVPKIPDEVKTAWPHYMWMLVAFLLTHIVTVIRPLFIYWRQRRSGDEEDTASSNRQRGSTGASSKKAFELVLTDSMLFEEFKHFAVKDFSVENALFYEKAAMFRRLPPVPVSASAADSEYLSKEARKIYYLFLREHADLQINISGPTLRNVESDMRLKRFHPSMFDRALTEIVALMWTDTYVRFVRSKSSDWRRDVVRRAGMLNSGGKGAPQAVGGAAVGMMGAGVNAAGNRNSDAGNTQRGSGLLGRFSRSAPKLTPRGSVTSLTQVPL